MNPLDVFLILFGLFTIYGAIAKPNFYWNSRRISRARKLIGDKTTQNMYVIVGIIMLIVGIVGMFGVLG